ncbi:MAG: glycosyltransferase family 4 protein [Simkaniaceae bacterium]|nr:glycosyltransferase family 4 protein [Simkaniaceae bacterium]MCF7852031.1 glycosyltransferase family 4 protein [Simkaniaceae bacterium]
MVPDHRQSLKVCFLKRHLNLLGGLEKYSRYLVNAFAARGYEVSFLCSNKEFNRPLDDQVQIIPVNPPLLFPLNPIQSFDKACQNWLKSHPMDIIFGLDRTSHQTHIRAGNGSHRAFIDRRKQIDSWIKQKTYFLNPTHKAILDIEQASFENPSLKKLFTNSSMVKDEILQYYSIDPHKIEVIHNGVEHRQMEPYFSHFEETKENLLKELNQPKDIHHLLFIGNGYFRKGLIPLLKALALLKEMPFHLYVIGKEKNTPYFRKEAHSLGLSKHVSFLGSQPDIMKFYALSDTLIIPSYYDPFANVTVEALAMGVYVISSPFNGGSEVLTAANGRIIPSLFDIDSFAEILENRLLERKTFSTALPIRESIKHLDFTTQLNKMIDACLE